MIIYFDTSALLKSLINEKGSEEVIELLAANARVGTAEITRAEISAALAKAVRMGAADRGIATTALTRFRSEWPGWMRHQITNELVAQGDSIAWEYGLRGYDAIHLAAAQHWDRVFDDRVVLATYDRRLWRAANATGLVAWPPDLEEAW